MNDFKGVHEFSSRGEQEKSPERFDIPVATREEGEQLVQAFWQEYLERHGTKRFPEQSVFEALFGGGGEDWSQVLTYSGDRTSLDKGRDGSGFVVFIRGNRNPISQRGLQIMKKLGY
ncbi:TPA: hypothetical protein DEB00_01905 [Candidatus Uhrbacteria bacterium]|nr:hypothetical protein [Candidatus Uhrbacteria bacterium]